MSNLTTEQLAELTERVNDRIAEWDLPDVVKLGRQLPRGVVRLVHDVIEEWWEGQTGPYPATDPAPDDPLTDGFHIGYQMAMQRYKATPVNGFEDAASPRLDLGQSERAAWREVYDSVTASHVAPDFYPDGAPREPLDQFGVAVADVERAMTEDFAEFEAAWPNIPDLQGEDVFAAEHGEPTGAPEPEPKPKVTVAIPTRFAELDADTVGKVTEEILHDFKEKVMERAAPPPPLLAPLPDPVRVPVLSPQAAATLGPEHTTLTPLRPIGRDRQADANSRPLSEADAEAKRQAELAEIIAHLQGIAKHGRLPTMTDYHGTRPKHLPMWAIMQSRHNLSSWQDLAALTGLEYGARHLRVAGDMDADDSDLDDADAEIDADDDGLDDDDEPATDGKRQRPNGTRKKHPRKMGYEYGRSMPDNRRTGPTRAEVIAFLQQIAMGGVMPSQTQFNLAKPALRGTATAQVTRLHTTWDELRQEAGLKPNPRAPLSSPAHERAAVA